MQEFFAKHQIRPQKIAVAVSGGADSLALVLMVKEELTLFGFEPVALTVNHHLRPAADTEAAYVAEVMRRQRIEHHILEWLEPKPLTGVEEAARKARYGLLLDWCRSNGVKVLLTAHHQNDQAETFLMRLARGSGLEGLSCMRETSLKNGVLIVRPLLDKSPAMLRQYLQKRHIKWVEDESNTDTKYLRNRLRGFMPELERATGISAQNLAATATRLQSAEEYMEMQINGIIAQDVYSPAANVFCFKHTTFLKWHREIKFRVISQLCRNDYIPRAEHILTAIATMSKLPFSGLTLGGREIFYNRGNIWIVPELNAKRKASRRAWKEFTEQNPQFADAKIPHKARVAILQYAEQGK